jgi:hypothetical protein
MLIPGDGVVRILRPKAIPATRIPGKVWDDLIIYHDDIE